MAPDSDSRLGLAAWRGDADDTRRLLDSGVHVDARHLGLTPLMYAVKEGHVVAARALLNAGADVNATADGANNPFAGMTPLLLAAVSRHKETLGLILDSGADVNAAADGLTSLHSAVTYSQLDMVATLLQAGADPNAVSEEGITPLSSAIPPIFEDADEGTVLKIVQLLLNAGADPCGTTGDGESLVAGAKGCGFARVAEALSRRGKRQAGLRDP